jgi:hypothetical protein
MMNWIDQLGTNYYIIMGAGLAILCLIFWCIRKRNTPPAGSV